MTRKSKQQQNECKLHCCKVSEERATEIREDISHWTAGGYAKEVSYGPACHCGLRGAKEPCPRHDRDREDQS